MKHLKRVGDDGDLILTTVEKPTMVIPADWIQAPEQSGWIWIYGAYTALPDDGRYEIVNRVLVIAPAPEGTHQDAVLRTAHYLLTYVEFAKLETNANLANCTGTACAC